MTDRMGGARPAPNRPGTESTVIDDCLLRAAARILARHHHPDWRPATDAELDAWGHGYGAGVRDKGGQEEALLLNLARRDWPPVATPGGGE